MIIKDSTLAIIDKGPRQAATPRHTMACVCVWCARVAF